MSKGGDTSEVVSKRGSIVRSPLVATFPSPYLHLRHYMSSQPLLVGALVVGGISHMYNVYTCCLLHRV